MSLKSTTLVQGRYPLAFVVSEANANRSRDNVTILAGQVLPAGSVLGKISASQKYTVYNDAASDGSEVAAGILCYAVNATNPSADVAAVAMTGDAEVIADELQFPSGTGDTAKAHAFADLDLRGIKCRPSTYSIPAP